jgi:hypothetical protein
MASREEYLSLALAALVLTVILVAAFMCIQLYDLRKPAACRGPKGPPEGFLAAAPYEPHCGTPWGALRGACRGLTGGAMPAVESASAHGNGLCGGLLGVPP